MSSECFCSAILILTALAVSDILLELSALDLSFSIRASSAAMATEAGPGCRTGSNYRYLKVLQLPRGTYSQRLN